MSEETTGKEIRDRIESMRIEWGDRHPDIVDVAGPCSEPGCCWWTAGYLVALEDVLDMINLDRLEFYR